MSLKASYYKNLILSTNRGYNKGIASNAKPLYLLSLFKGIEEGILLGNRIKFDEIISNLYMEECHLFESWRIPAKFYKPFFHLQSEPYYYIKWKDGVRIVNALRTPSAKFLRENVEYACLDDDLWELLQDADTRNELRDAIIEHFIKPRT